MEERAAFSPVDFPFLKIAGDIHLHDREALAASLGIPACDVNQAGDTCLVLKAYEKWGCDCPSHLEGSFSFAIWDERTRRLLLCRDHLGSRPLFYWRQAGRFAFASDLLTLFRLPGIPRQLNRRKLAALAVPHGWEFHQDETLHEGILSLRPGSWLTFDREGLNQRTYWSPAINSGLIPRGEADAFAMGRELLFAAVRNRIRGKTVVATQLSGGLDSSAITAIAARCLAEKNRELLAFSAVLPENRTPRPKGEREFADEFRLWPNIRIQYVSAEGRGPFDFLDRPEEFEACFGTSSRRYLEEALSGAEGAAGADVVLSGIEGELGATVSGRGFYADLLVSFRWASLWRELKAMSRVPDRVPRRFGPLRSLGGEFLDLVKPYRGWGRGAAFYLTAEFKRECQARSFFRRSWKNQRQRQLETIRVALRRHSTRHLTAAPTAVDHVFPLFDRRLLEFCLAAPGNMKVRDGYSRFLVRRALDGILPEKIQWRTTKTPFSPDYFFRFNAQLKKAREFLAQIRPTDPVRTIVDVDRMQGLLHPVDPLGENYDALGVPMSFYLICFLRQFPEFRP